MEKNFLENRNNEIRVAVYAVERDICQFMREKGLTEILTTDKECDRIYSYDYETDDSNLEETIVIGVRLHTDDKGNDYLGVVVLPIDDFYAEDEIKVEDIREGGRFEDNECSLFGGIISGWFTAINLAELLFEYVK